jgi:tetratricopeptide (TPR) repeat protein
LEEIVPSQTPRTESAEAGTSEKPLGLPASQKGLFRKEGEYWTVGLGGNGFRLKDVKGLAYVAHLLRHPATEFHALDLIGGIAGRGAEVELNQPTQDLPHGQEELEKAGIHIASLGDAGEMLDEQAKANYRRRLSDLREELEDAKRLGRVERAEQLEAEIDSLTRELSRAVGLGGRSRRAASASERARQNISKLVKAVLEKVAQNDVTLGDFLSRCIKTGTFCSYQPEPDLRIAWEFAATSIESTGPPHISSEPTPTSNDSTNASSAVLGVYPFSLAERTAFVGRETERGVIRAAIDRALRGRGSLVMLAGGPGVGKTRLAMEMAEYAYALNGFRVLFGRCYERDEPLPYLPFAEIVESNLAQAPSLDDFRRQMGNSAAELAQLAPSLRRVFPDLPESIELPPAQRRRYLFQSFSDALGRWAQIYPLLLILDDLQWADESTLALLVHLASRLSGLPLLIIGTYRDEFFENNSALVRSLEELIRLGVSPLKIAGLSKHGVWMMLDQLSERRAPENLVAAIFEESQGNPFFVEEVYRHLSEEGRVFDAAGEFRRNIEIDEIDVPENVRLIIGRRLQRLSRDEKKVLQAAAVIGRSFSFQLLSDVTQSRVDEVFEAIEKAQQMRIIVPSSEGPETPLAFVHELVRQTLLVGIVPPARQRLHGIVAGAIERLQTGGLNSSAGEIADHLLKAGSFADLPKLAYWLMQAGKAALNAAAFEEAKRSFRSALSHEKVIQPAEKADLLNSLATAHRCLGEWEAEVASRREAVEICVNLGDRERMGESSIGLTEALRFADRLREATETAQRGLAYLGPDVSANRAHILGVLAGILTFTEGYDPASEALREALEIARHLSDPTLEARLLRERAALNSIFFHLREAIADGLLSEQFGALEALPHERNAQLIFILLARLHLGHMEEALRTSDEIESLVKKVGRFNSSPMDRCAKVWIEFGKDADLARYETELVRALQFDQTEEYRNVLSEAYQGVVNFLRGNWTAALTHIQASCRSGPSEHIRGVPVAMLFFLLAYMGDREGALTILDENRMLLPRLDQHNLAASWCLLAVAVEGLAMLGEQSQAGELYPLVRELIGTGTVLISPLCRFTQTTAGIAAAAARQWDSAEEDFSIALRQAESVPYILEQAEIRRFHAMMLLDRAASGDRENARTLLSEALETYSRIGMRRHIELAQALLDKALVD